MNSQKGKKVIYWIATIWLALGLVSTGIVQLLHTPDGVGGGNMMIALGYPVYLMTLLGILKIAGAIALLLPGLKLVKQWTYAGIGFLVVGAVYSHLAMGGGVNSILPILLILVLMAVSFIYLPENRKISLNF